MSYLPYVTVKARLNIPDPLDDIGQLLTDSATSLIERVTGRTFSPRSLTLTEDEVRQRLTPSGLYYPVLFPCASVTIDSVPQRRRGQFFVLDRMGPAEEVGGMPQPPMEIVQATLELIQYNLNRWKAKNFGVKAQGMDSLNIQYEFEMPLSTRKVLEVWTCLR